MKRANGWLFDKNGKQVSAVVQAKTKKRMVELLIQVKVNLTMKHLNTYWHMCWGTPATKSIGDDCQEEGVWMTSDLDHDKNYKKVI